ncbi:MAG: AAA family ATPase [Deltaproteobacteria bacterium]|jgi:hypothetical protein|nr:AAA family ATPase [Deltaproteobacteria bacterium]
MADTLKSLPTKSQSFADIVKSGAIYADKTDTIAHIVTSMDNETEAKAVLLTRPKGFGKTLTISTLESILSKDRHKHFLNFGFVNNYQSPVAPRPVIRLDMGQANASEGLEEFKRSLRSLTFKKADELGVSTPDHLSPAEALDNLISSLSRKSWQQGIAILVDDYDQPLCDLALKPWREEGEKLLAGFYGELKYYDQRVSFILAAGVSAYHESGELSYLKNFADISRIPCCGWLCGFTHEELERYFGAHIEAAAKSLDMTPEKLFGVMQSRYEG